MGRSDIDGLCFDGGSSLICVTELALAGKIVKRFRPSGPVHRHAVSRSRFVQK
jgi:hypothetical protein